MDPTVFSWGGSLTAANIATNEANSGEELVTVKLTDSLLNTQQLSNTNMAIPLNKKLYFSVYGNYTLDKKRSVILPATSIPYQIGAGFSYEIGKYVTIKSQTNYQYHIIQRRWEWFFGAGVSFTF